MYVVVDAVLSLYELLWSVHARCTNMCLCVYVSAEALQLQREALWSKRGRRSAELEELMRSLEQWGDVTAGQHGEAKQQGAYLNMEIISLTLLQKIF